VYKALAALAGLALAGCTTDGAARTGAAYNAARLATLEAYLAAYDSATEALTQYCAAERIADPALITARPVRGGKITPPGNLREMLAAKPGEPIGYRHVRLSCGRQALSFAHNWYVAARLTPEMNRALAETDTPFGKVAGSLGFRREPLETQFTPPPECPKDTVSAHRALLRLPDGQPLAYVVECYTAANLTAGS
jgi:hypothetical protein